MSRFFGGSAYVANTAVFDGTADSMRAVTTTPTGLADGKLFTCSFWVDFSGGDAANQIIAAFSTPAEADRFVIRRRTTNTINILGYDSAGNPVLSITSTNTIVAAAGYTHIYICCDMADTAKRKIYFNGVAETLSVATYTNSNIDFDAGTLALYGVGAYPTAVPLDRLFGTLCELWWDDTYLDDPTKFASGGKPISLGSDGSTPTGAAPVFYFKGSGNGFNVNSGTGGNMTITGSLGTTTPP